MMFDSLLCRTLWNSSEDGAYDGWPAVDVQLEEVFASYGVWGGKVDDEG